MSGDRCLNPRGAGAPANGREFVLHRGEQRSDPGLSADKPVAGTSASRALCSCTRQVLFTRSARITLCTRPELLLDRGVISLAAEFGLERDLLIPYKLSSTANAAARAPTHTRAERTPQYSVDASTRPQFGATGRKEISGKV
jgi:hypothetical protein